MRWKVNAKLIKLIDEVKRLRAIELHWTTERPTVPGWYWYRSGPGDHPEGGEDLAEALEDVRAMLSRSPDNDNGESQEVAS